MKVQGLNSSSKKTRKLIMQTFAELINEKKEISKITVTELVKRAGITRSTFYTHYDSIYEVGDDYQFETIELLISDDNVLNSVNDIYKYFDDIIICLKKNENIYKMLLASNDSLYFLEKLKRLSTQKIYYTLKNANTNNDEYLELSVTFFMNGIIDELFKYFRGQSDYNLDELLVNMKKWFEKMFS